MIAVLFNVLSGLGALRLSPPPQESPASTRAPSAAESAADSGMRACSWSGSPSSLSGFVAMALEIVWFRTERVFGSFRTILSAILTVILVGIWLGSLFGGVAAPSPGAALSALHGAQALLVVFSLARPGHGHAGDGRR